MALGRKINHQWMCYFSESVCFRERLKAASGLFGTAGPREASLFPRTYKKEHPETIVLLSETSKHHVDMLHGSGRRGWRKPMKGCEASMQT